MLQLLLVLLFLLLPSGVLLRINIFQSAFLSPLDIIVFLISLIVFFSIVKRKVYKNNKAFLYFIIFMMVGLISLFINSFQLTTADILIAFLYACRYICYSSLLFVGPFIHKKFKEKIEYMFIGSGIVVVLFGFIQYIFYQNLRNLYYLGWDDHLYRMFSTFLDPNFAGAFFVLYLLFLVNLVLLIKDKALHKGKLIFIVLFSILTGIAILLTHSRSAIIMLVVALFAFFAYKRLFKVLIFSLGIVIFLFFLSSNRTVESLNPFRIASSEARLLSARDAISIIGHSPIYGVGFNAYRYAQIKYGIRNELGARMSHADAATDNSFLFVLATTGIIGLIVYLAFYWQIIESSKRERNGYRFLILAMIVGLFIDTLFINSLFYTPILLWVNGVIGIFGFEKARDYR